MLSASSAAVNSPISAASSARMSKTMRACPGTTFAAFGRISRMPVVATKWPVPARRRIHAPARDDEQHERGGRERRIPAIVHRRRAGVIGGAVEHDLDAGDADDRGDEAEVDPVVLEHRALLDMQFEIARDVASAAPAPSRCHVAADAVDGVGRASRRSDWCRPAACRRARPPWRGCRRRRRRIRSAPRRGNPRPRWRARARYRAACIARTTSSAAMTPAGPSKRPPEGTVSECEPSMMVRASGSAPSRRPIRLARGIDAAP